MPEGKLSDVRLGGRIMGPSTCLLINESGATARVTKARHQEELVTLPSSHPEGVLTRKPQKR